MYIATLTLIRGSRIFHDFILIHTCPSLLAPALIYILTISTRALSNTL